MHHAVIVEDHAAFAEMTEATLRRDLSLSVDASISTFAKAIVQLPALSPNIVILDNRLEDGTGLGLVRSLKKVIPRTRWLLYSGYASASTLREAIDVGVDGAVSKRAPLPVFFEAIEALLAGRQFFCEFTTKEMRENDEREKLSSTENQIIKLVASGLEAKEIAAIIGVAHKTVLNSLVSIRRKTKTESLVQISDYARKLGLSNVDQ